MVLVWRKAKERQSGNNAIVEQQRSCQQERLRVLFLRKTLVSLTASALVTFQEQVLHKFDGKRSLADGVTYFGGNNITPAQFTYEDTGSTIVVGGMVPLNLRDASTASTTDGGRLSSPRMRS